MAAAEGQGPLSSLLLVVLSGWSVTYSSFSATDHGNGKIVATTNVVIEVTPTEVKTRTESTDHGKKQPTQKRKQPLAADTRDAIEALLPKLPDKATTYSISDFVNDEGGYGETLTLERDGNKVAFELVQGKQAPPLPPELEELKKLIARAQKK